MLTIAPMFGIIVLPRDGKGELAMLEDEGPQHLWLSLSCTVFQDHRGCGKLCQEDNHLSSPTGQPPPATRCTGATPPCSDEDVKRRCLCKKPNSWPRPQDVHPAWKNGWKEVSMAKA